MGYDQNPAAGKQVRQRSKLLADLDHDGRLEVILKNRNAPQLRVLHNGMKDLGAAVSRAY